MITNAKQILEASDLLEVIGKHATLKRAGHNHTGKCPFPTHEEKTGSFTVSTAKNIYKCFGCGVGGSSPAKFLMQKLDITFPQALAELAKEARIEVQYDGNKDWKTYIAEETKAKDHKSKMFSVSNEVAQIYAPQLDLAGKELAGKTYTAETITKWGLCVAPSSVLTTTESLDQTSLQELGLIKPAKKGGFYDFFYKRLLFPVRIGRDRIAGYTARILDDAKGPKYLNSSDSAIFNKGKILYGLAENDRHIEAAGYAILVEGSTDVVILDQYGISTAVTCLGTAFTLTQAKLLSRSADSVIKIADGDAAGRKSIDRDIKTILKAQMEPYVYLLEEGEDPASQAQKWDEGGLTPSTIMLKIDQDKQCGIEYLVSKTLGQGSGLRLSAAVAQAAELIATVDNDIMRKAYVKSLCKSLLLHQTKELTAQIKDIISDTIELENRLSEAQKAQKDKFEIYQDKHRYYNNKGVRISNFVIRPKFLIYDTDSAQRVFEIINDEREEVLIQIESDDMTSLGSFKKRIEREGTYVWKGSEHEYTCLRHLVYSDVDKAYPIHTLGHHNNGFYAWANGATMPDGSFQSVNEYGIINIPVKRNGQKKILKYYLPEHCEKKTVSETDESNTDELLQNFIYVDDSKVPQSFEQWAIDFKTVMGDRGIMALCHYMATVHRDIIYDKNDTFPILNLFGPKGSGKTYLQDILYRMFGKPIKSIHLLNTTKAAFFRRAAQVRNAIAPYEEYSEKVPDFVVEGLKSFFDGFGRDLATLSGHRTKKVPVNSSIWVSGQILPTHDVALLERMLTERFVVVQATQEQKAAADRLKINGSAGGYSRYTAEIYALREKVIAEYDHTLKGVKDNMLAAIDKSEMPNTRVMTNFTMLPTIYSIVSKYISLPWKISEVQDRCIERMLSQSVSVEAAQELSDWWRIVALLIELGKKHQGTQGISQDYYTIHRTNKIKIIKDKKIIDKTLEETSDLIMLRIKHVFSLYRKEAKSGDSNRVLDWSSLEYYMKTSSAFIGNKKSHRFAENVNTSAWVFDLAYIKECNELLPTRFDNESSKPSAHDAAQPELGDGMSFRPMQDPFEPIAGETPE